MQDHHLAAAQERATQPVGTTNGRDPTWNEHAQSEATEVKAGVGRTPGQEEEEQQAHDSSLAQHGATVTNDVANGAFAEPQEHSQHDSNHNTHDDEPGSPTIHPTQAAQARVEAQEAAQQDAQDEPHEHNAAADTVLPSFGAVWGSLPAVNPILSPGSSTAQQDTGAVEVQRWAEATPYWRLTASICPVYSMDRTRMYAIRIHPRIESGFFLADGDWTCYRRNYFQLSIGFSAMDLFGARLEMPCLVSVENKLQVVTGFLLGISARTSNGQRPIELVQLTAKRAHGPQLVPEPKYCQPQDNPSAYGRANVDMFHTVTFDRLQFKAATTNNGKRRSAQQYHVLVAELFAEHEGGERNRIATSESAPLVVRGRSPGHYKEMHSRTGAGGHAGAVPAPEQIPIPPPEHQEFPPHIPIDFRAAHGMMVGAMLQPSEQQAPGSSGQEDTHTQSAPTQDDGARPENGIPAAQILPSPAMLAAGYHLYQQVLSTHHSLNTPAGSEHANNTLPPLANPYFYAPYPSFPYQHQQHPGLGMALPHPHQQHLQPQPQEHGEVARDDGNGHQGQTSEAAGENDGGHD
ncbi:uncharacterized protein EV422DRAFT_514183 [Fimicolochytrium jonesii]|uniref:uncharacterized protein n=1 Tax=Fimicolochytrium jonesii TaxID=1396493 RepID=UPI0022FE75B3|nr:uncharacterized protein EV422DRAFT_514183 [Fimicolochytrium jonesii]KAI8825798.1 hypothetical protein EV422DRAFT_514183 [Fimicolochytrium jonesii]